MKRLKKVPFLMHPEHPRWEEFCERLWVAIDFEVEMKEGKDWTFTANYDTNPDRPHTFEVLTAMGADVSASLALFQSMGGHCDCEVILNCDLFRVANAN